MSLEIREIRPSFGGQHFMRRPLQPTENGPETLTSKRWSTKKKQKNADTQRKEERGRYDEGNLGRGKEGGKARIGSAHIFGAKQRMGCRGQREDGGEWEMKDGNGIQTERTRKIGIFVKSEHANWGTQYCEDEAIIIYYRGYYFGRFEGDYTIRRVWEIWERITYCYSTFNNVNAEKNSMLKMWSYQKAR